MLYLWANMLRGSSSPQGLAWRGAGESLVKWLSSPPWSISAGMRTSSLGEPFLQFPSTSGLPAMGSCSARAHPSLVTVSFRLLREEKEMTKLYNHPAFARMKPYLYQACSFYLSRPLPGKTAQEDRLTEPEFKNNYINNKYVKLHLKQ